MRRVDKVIHRPYYYTYYSLVGSIWIYFTITLTHPPSHSLRVGAHFATLLRSRRCILRRRSCEAEDEIENSAPFTRGAVIVREFSSRRILDSGRHGSGILSCNSRKPGYFGAAAHFFDPEDAFFGSDPAKRGMRSPKLPRQKNTP